VNPAQAMALGTFQHAIWMEHVDGQAMPALGTGPRICARQQCQAWRPWHFSHCRGGMGWPNFGTSEFRTRAHPDPSQNGHDTLMLAHKTPPVSGEGSRRTSKSLLSLIFLTVGRGNPILMLN
jgi:hypothetical protein